MNILITKSASSPYRVDFYNALGKLANVDVIYEYKIAHDRDKSWSLKKAESFNEYFLEKHKLIKKLSVSLGYKKFLTDRKYDIIVVSEYSTITGMLMVKFLKKHKIPFLLNIDGGIIKDDGGIRRKIKEGFITAASYWLSPSGDSDKYLIHYGGEKERIFRYPFTSVKEEDVINETVSLDEKQRLKDKLGITEDKVIISVGQFIPRKGHDILIEACKDMDKSVGIYIVGGQPTEEYLALKEKYGMTNLHFVDFRQKDELNKYYRAANVFCLATKEDIWGLVINEAMAQGLPVITTDKCVAGLELIENGKNGYIVPVENADATGEALNKILKDISLEEKMSAVSLKKISGYTIEQMAKRHLDIFNEIISKKEI